MDFIKKNKTYIAWAVFTLLVGGLSALFSGGFSTYSSYIQPPLSPPAFIFPIVWTILFVLMGIAAGIVYKSNDLDKANCIKIYLIQLFINFLWPLIFFRFKAAKFALFWLLLLIIAVLATYNCFKKVDKKAGNLLIPYIIWLLFAFYLNFGIVVLNS